MVSFLNTESIKMSRLCDHIPPTLWVLKLMDFEVCIRHQFIIFHSTCPLLSAGKVPTTRVASYNLGHYSCQSLLVSIIFNKVPWPYAKKCNISSCGWHEMAWGEVDLWESNMKIQFQHLSAKSNLHISYQRIHVLFNLGWRGPWLLISSLTIHHQVFYPFCN